MPIEILGILALVFAVGFAVCTRATSGSFVRRDVEDRASAVYSYFVGRGGDLTHVHYIKLSDVVGGTLTLDVLGTDENGQSLNLTLTREGVDATTGNPPARLQWALGMLSDDMPRRAEGWRMTINRLADLCANHGRITVERSSKPLLIEIKARPDPEGDGTYTRREAAGKGDSA